MKAKTKLVGLLVFLVGAITVPTFAEQSTNELDFSVDVRSINSVDERAPLSYSLTKEGIILGPEDYQVIDGAVYVLDSSRDRIVKYSNGSFEVEYDFSSDNIGASRIAKSSDNLYVLDAKNNGIIRIGSDKDIDISNIDDIELTTVTDFQIINEKLYITNSTYEGVITRVYSDKNGLLEKENEFQGRVLSDGSMYRSTLLKEENKSVGHGVIVTITDSNGEFEKEITINSDYWIIGAQYLGNENGNYLIKTVEVMSDQDYEIVHDETVKVFDDNANFIGTIPMSEQFKGINDNIKYQDGEFFRLVNSSDAIEFTKVNFNEVENDYISDLSTITEPENEEVDFDTDRMPKISRASIISNANSYRNTSYSVTSKNLQNNTGQSYWSKPHYYGGPGTYYYIPYNWGGNDTVSGFISKIKNGASAGNTSCTGGEKNNTAGVDCSGFVGRCWGLSTKYSTSTIPNISTKITASSLQRGDCLNDKGDHVMLFESFDGYNTYTLHESNTQYARVAYMTRYKSSVGSYTPYRYTGTTN